jgi:hypothetical protein
MKYTFELDQETMDNIVLQTLKEDFLNLRSDIKRLISRADDLESYQRIDLQDNIKYYSALAIILQYYMTVDDYTKFVAR